MILLGINRQMSEGLFFSEEEEERIRQKVYRIFEDILKTNKMPNIVQEEVSLIKRPDYKLSFVPVSEGEEGKQQKKVLRIVVYPEENKTYCIKNKQGITYKKEEV